MRYVTMALSRVDRKLIVNGNYDTGLEPYMYSKARGNLVRVKS